MKWVSCSTKIPGRRNRLYLALILTEFEDTLFRLGQYQIEPRSIACAYFDGIDFVHYVNGVKHKKEGVKYWARLPNTNKIRS